VQIRDLLQQFPGLEFWRFQKSLQWIEYAVPVK